MIDFIPVSEYAHYFDVAVLCMVLTAVWQCHTGSVLKKRPCRSTPCGAYYLH